MPGRICTLLGSSGAALEEHRGRALLSPGDFLTTGARLELELSKGKLNAFVTTLEGDESARLELTLSARTKLSAHASG